MTREEKLAALKSAISSNVMEHEPLSLCRSRLFEDISPLICDGKDRLERIATAAMHAALSRSMPSTAEDLASGSVAFASALIAELDKEERKRVTINAFGFSDSDLFTGSQIREMFDRINEELDKEGE